MKVFLFLLLVSFISYSQPFTHNIIVLNNNYFQIDDIKRVSIPNLAIPALSDSASFGKLSLEINDWLKGYFEGNTFSISYENGDFADFKKFTDNSSDLKSELLFKGYAIYTGSPNWSSSEKYISAQSKAKDNKSGIWSLDEKVLNQFIQVASVYYLSRMLPDTSSSTQTVAPLPLIIPKLQAPKVYESPYLPLLGLSIASFLLAWDSFATASDIQDDIDFFKKLDKKFDSSGLESQKSRKTIVGVAFVLAGLTTTIFSFSRVEVKSDFNRVTLSYNF